ncbi:sensor histidine kinase [Salinicola rhizosphaerae]|uniref:histidine kinase n=1 Tax=Salinicola rhizosphaerae TaxID=1443141 RepID=A0ABQ3EFE9_9GAMM|nr:sensor histidine kinase KdpD [Salinicola rhizosphaerae]GHB34623.1 two-component sensor histidine kinase [Salinicola rhizosphaerae]
MSGTREAGRPDPDALLATTRESGSLRVFLGAAPGVGKTCTMLRTARERLAAGEDVLLGVIEAHGRSETEQLCEGLPTLPPVTREHHGRGFAEFDLDGALARRPAILLVDELAHRNIPGGRHARRWQDIEELLDAGIEVWTTLNVQHVESLNDDVARITGIRMRETVPDRLIMRARDVSLVDLTPQELIERLQQGKVYVPEQARAALSQYFSPGNLTALRELALQVMSQRLDSDVRRVMDAGGVAGPWPVRARLLVAVKGKRGDQALLRAASRWAQRHQAPWEAVQVTPLSDLDTAAASESSNLRQQTEQLGGRWETLSGDDPLGELLDHAARHNITALMIGRAPLKRRWWRAPLVDRLLKQRLPFDLIVLAEENTASSRAGPRLPRWQWPPCRWLRRDEWLWPVLGVGVASLVAQLMSSEIELANLSLIFLAAVLASALQSGTRSAMLAVALSGLVYNFLFTEPRFSLAMIQKDQILTVLIFCLVAVVAGQLAGKVRRQVTLLRQSRQQIQEMLAVSRALSAAADHQRVREIAVTALADHLQLPCVFVDAPGAGEAPRVSASHSGSVTLDGPALQAARWSYQHGRASGHGTQTLAAQRFRFLPIRESGGKEAVHGVLGLALGDRARGDRQEGNRQEGNRQGSDRAGTLDAAEEALIDSLINQLGTALSRTRLVADLGAARLAEENERLRSALLSSVSHDLRTPLASIIGSASALRDLWAEMPDADRRELLDGVLDESERLNRYIQNLLDMTRLGHGGLKLERDWVALSDIVGSALKRLGSVVERLHIERHFDDDLPLLYVHPALIEQALINVIENAARFSPEGGRLRLAASRDGGQVVIRIADQGPGIPEALRERIFDMFFSGGDGDRGPQGSGLGLAICRGMVGAHGGEIAARPADWGTDSGAGSGTEIVIRLPVWDPPEEREIVDEEP